MEEIIIRNNQPIDKGRVCFIAEKYPTNQLGQDNQPIMKNRYAALGRATKWPADQSGPESVDIELDSIPLGHQGKLKLFIFWDSESNNQQPQQGGHQQQPQNYGGHRG